MAQSAANSLAHLADQAGQRTPIFWVMLPAGDPTEDDDR